MKKVKNVITGLCVFILLCAFLGTCNNSTSSRKKNKHPLAGTDWVLLEVRTPEAVITLDRSLLSTTGMSDVFVLQFNKEAQIRGTAAASRYSANCTWNDDSGIFIGPIVIQESSPPRELPFKEEDFFDYLGRVDHWRLTDNGTLHLYHSDNEYINPTYLIFGK